MSKNISTTPPVSCTLCPRRCGADRAAGQTGFCGAGGTQRLIRSVGKALASRMVLSGESIDARQAQQAGLVSDIHPAALTDEYALKLATTIARHSPLALRAAKQSLRLSQEVSLQAGLQQERQLFSLLSATEDRREGIDAFLQKRTPDFKGR